MGMVEAIMPWSAPDDAKALEGAVDFPPLMADLADIGANPLWAPEVFSSELSAKGPQQMAEAIREATLAVLR